MKNRTPALYFHPLNFIRFVLAVGVLLFHYGLNYYPFQMPFLKTLILNSSFRVSFFFFISGFVMSLVYSRTNNSVNPRYFYWKRLTRILPVYWLAFFITLLVVVLLKGSSPKGFVIILHFLGLQSWDPGYVLDLNYTTWSISVELVFYSFFPFLLNWMMKQGIKKLLITAMMAWILQSLQHVLFVNYLSDGSKVMEEFINAFPLWHLSTFFIGMTTARLITLEIFPDLFRKLALLFLILALGVFAYLIYLPNPVLKYIHNGLLAPLFGIFVAALFYDRSFLHKFLSLKSVSKLGDLSYGIFIFQYPLWVICTTLAGEENAKRSLFFLIYFSIVLFVSWLVNRYFEKPILAHLRRQP